MVLVNKQILCCKKRQAPPTEVLRQKTKKYGMDINKCMEKPLKEMRQEVRRRQTEFWECRKLTETERSEWIIKLAKDRAQADQDPEWEDKMERMLQTVREKATNRKFTAILKGPYQSVQSIRVPVSKLFHSREKTELYKFNKEVFEAHHMAGNNKYWNHYTHKVPYGNYKEVIV